MLFSMRATFQGIGRAIRDSGAAQLLRASMVRAVRRREAQERLGMADRSALVLPKTPMNSRRWELW